MSLLQFMHPSFTAYMVNVGGVDWKTDFTDPKRREWQEKKMKSKDVSN